MNTGLNPIRDETLAELRELLGPGGYLDAAADIEPFLTDHRKLYRGATPLVALPDSTARVAGVVRLCAAASIGIVPHGGNTSYCGGATPRESGTEIVLSLRRMKRIRKIDALNYSLTVEAGCVLGEVQRAAESADRLFPMSLGSEGSCTIGGNLSTNAGGTAVLRYGMMRDLVLGLEVVLPDGRVLDQLRPLRKDNTGYDLKQLFIGAEGTLGVITAACLKLFPRPRGYSTALIALASPQAAVDLLAGLRGSLGDSVTTFELIPRSALDIVCRHIDGATDPFDKPYLWYVLAEVSLPQQDSDGPRREAAGATGGRDGPGNRPRCRAGGLAGPARGLLEAAREHPRGADARRREPEARYLDPDPGPARLHRRRRGNPRKGDPGRTTGRLRPSRRRQPALQPRLSPGDGPGGVSATGCRCAARGP